jgi:2-polyprenyl-6-methoxyphenol hydroxylase-like FAD-dependent oxidoreductase
VIVVGARPSGIASALALKDAGLRALVLDRADQVAGAWRGRYDSASRRAGRPSGDGRRRLPHLAEAACTRVHKGPLQLDYRIGIDHGEPMLGRHP